MGIVIIGKCRRENHSLSGGNGIMSGYIDRFCGSIWLLPGKTSGINERVCCHINHSFICPKYLHSYKPDQDCKHQDIIWVAFGFTDYVFIFCHDRNTPCILLVGDGCLWWEQSFCSCYIYYKRCRMHLQLYGRKK